MSHSFLEFGPVWPEPGSRLLQYSLIVIIATFFGFRRFRMITYKQIPMKVFQVPCFCVTNSSFQFFWKKMNVFFARFLFSSSFPVFQPQRDKGNIRILVYVYPHRSVNLLIILYNYFQKIPNNTVLSAS